MLARRILLGLALSFAALSGARAADTYADLLNQFNEIVFGNVVSASETEGRAVIGGSLTQSGVGKYCFQSSDGSGPCTSSTLAATTPQVGSITVGSTTQSFGALAVYGNTSGGITAQYGNAFLGGTNTATLSAPLNSQTIYVKTQGTSSAVGGNGNLVYQTASVGVTPSSQNGTVTQGSFTLPSFATTFQNPLTTLSTALANLSGINQGTSNTFNATPTTINGVKVAVYNVTGSNLATDITNFNFTLGTADTVVINVRGSVGALGNLNAFTGQNKVIWNFVDQTSLTLPAWAGTILAPLAAVTLTGISQGDVVAASLNQGANEIHNYAFQGKLSFVNAPEPASMSILGIGLGGSFVAARRRQSQKR